jgi:hypothetical protein
MAIYLKNSMFVHIPKCGGRWVKQMIESHIHGYEYSGDPIYDAHDSPDEKGRQPFAFVREPATFAHSLWHHRAKKKANKFGHKFNWQTYIRMEEECQSEDYQTFMNNVADNPNAVSDYYKHYIGRYEHIRIGRMEYLSTDFVSFLKLDNEEANYEAIEKSGQSKIGLGTDQSPVDGDIRVRINRANEEFCARMGYLSVLDF